MVNPATMRPSDHYYDPKWYDVYYQMVEFGKRQDPEDLVFDFGIELYTQFLLSKTEEEIRRSNTPKRMRQVIQLWISGTLQEIPMRLRGTMYSGPIPAWLSCNLSFNYRFISGIRSWKLRERMNHWYHFEHDQLFRNLLTFQELLEQARTFESQMLAEEVSDFELSEPDEIPDFDAQEL